MRWAEIQGIKGVAPKQVKKESPHKIASFFLPQQGIKCGGKSREEREGGTGEMGGILEPVEQS